jgi:phosphatidylinositol glycan class V
MAIEDVDRSKSLLRKFALPQLLLAVLALTTFHVQIINRISSGYPVWYFVVAVAMEGSRFAGVKVEGEVKSGKGTGVMCYLEEYAEWIVRAGVVYAVVQGGLYASFMPPA